MIYTVKIRVYVVQSYAYSMFPQMRPKTFFETETSHFYDPFGFIEGREHLLTARLPYSLPALLCNYAVRTQQSKWPQQMSIKYVTQRKFAKICLNYRKISRNWFFIRQTTFSMSPPAAKSLPHSEFLKPSIRER